VIEALPVSLVPVYRVARRGARVGDQRQAGEFPDVLPGADILAQSVPKTFLAGIQN
jgi:hypothetical protein